jgi:AcrR family transcriptional regulator
MQRSANPDAPEQGARERQKQQTRLALLAAARRVLAQRGFAATTTREIALEAKVAAGTFFVHFPSVGALVSALLDEHVAKALAGALRSAAKKRGVVAQLLHVCNALFESYDEEPELARAYITGSLFPTAAPQVPSARLASFRVWVVERIDAAISSGELPDIDRELAFISFFSIYFGLLVSGLNQQLVRKRQLALLQAALTRLFLLEESP